MAISALRSMTHAMRGIDRAYIVPTVSSLHLERASATVLVLPDLYSTRKLKPNSLLTHCCCGDVVRRSNKNFKLNCDRCELYKCFPKNKYANANCFDQPDQFLLVDGSLRCC